MNACVCVLCLYTTFRARPANQHLFFNLQLDSSQAVPPPPNSDTDIKSCTVSNQFHREFLMEGASIGRNGTSEIWLRSPTACLISGVSRVQPGTQLEPPPPPRSQLPSGERGVVGQEIPSSCAATRQGLRVSVGLGVVGLAYICISPGAHMCVFGGGL